MNKKNFIQKALAAVFVSGFVACGQSPVLVDTEIENVGLKQPDKGVAIEFSTFANRSTRAVATVSDLEFYHQTFKVFATKTSDEGSKVQTIFQGVEVKAQISETEEGYQDRRSDRGRRSGRVAVRLPAGPGRGGVCTDRSGPHLPGRDPEYYRQDHIPARLPLRQADPGIRTGNRKGLLGSQRSCAGGVPKTGGIHRM